MGTGYEIGCNKCSFRRSLRVGVGMVHSSLEAEIESTSRKEQQTIKQIISGKQNLISEGEGYSIFQCSTCCAIVNKFHIKIIENNQTLYQSKTQCFKCNTEMQLLPCDEDENTIEGIKCPKCKSDDVIVGHNMMWD